MPEAQLVGSVVVVTGGASGIGRELAARFAAEGARAVVVTDRNSSGAEDVAAGLSSPVALGLGLDVSDEVAVKAAAPRKAAPSTAPHTPTPATPPHVPQTLDAYDPNLHLYTPTGKKKTGAQLVGEALTAWADARQRGDTIPDNPLQMFPDTLLRGALKSKGISTRYMSRDLNSLAWEVYKQYAPALQAKMKQALEKVAAQKLSNDVAEVITKALAN